MDISKIDMHLAQGKVDNDIKWTNCLDEPFSLHGVFYNQKENLFVRVPQEVVEETGNPSLEILSRMTSGGRIRFVTDSDFIAIKASLPALSPAPNLPITLSHGFSVYADGKFRNRYSPVFKDFTKVEEFENFRNKIYFAEKKVIADTKKERLVEVYFPLYGGVSELYIGVSEDAVIKQAPEYKLTKPMVFYGSSITQGASVSRPGNDYVSMIAQRFNSDYINLGFSGNGNAEDAMIDYVNSIDASLYAFDYNYYPSKKDRVLPPHFSIYQRIREKHPDAVILMYDKPGCDYEPCKEREEMIFASYKKALELGDTKVCYVSPWELFGEGDRDCCMVDVSHPNDLGAIRMTNSICSVIDTFFK